MQQKQKLLLTALVVGVLGSLAGIGVYGLFTATTQNSGNEISSGTVSFADNDSGSALYNATGVRPGDVTTRCLKTTYTGTLPATARLYGSGNPGPLAQYIDLTITQGTQPGSTFPSCTGFAADAAGVIYSGTLQNFQLNRSGYSTGISIAPAGQAAWSAGSSSVYRFQATLQSSAPDSSQGASSGVHSFFWEARNQ